MRVIKAFGVVSLGIIVGTVAGLLLVLLLGSLMERSPSTDPIIVGMGAGAFMGFIFAFLDIDSY